ncbi:hypothetical protein OG21DRAFT_1488458 [Imleria badia]|nr:hypothetical protein OG21DRAFT_1488458 [Imleria badia]
MPPFRPAVVVNPQQQTPSTGSIGKSLAAKPEMYDGDKAKFIQWMRNVTLYIAGFERQPSDLQKIMMLLSYMRGENTAGQFADLFVTQEAATMYTMSTEDFIMKLNKEKEP